MECRLKTCLRIRYMYWTGFGPRRAYISKAGLDGSNPEQIVTTALQRPVSLALDSSRNSIYWVDAGLRTIETAKTDGSQRRVVLRDMSRRPFGIAVYQVSLCVSVTVVSSF